MHDNKQDAQLSHVLGSLAPLVLIRVASCPFVVSCRFPSWTSRTQPPSGGDTGRFLSVKSVKSVVEKPRLGLLSGFELRISDLIGAEPLTSCPSVSLSVCGRTNPSVDVTRFGCG